MKRFTEFITIPIALIIMGIYLRIASEMGWPIYGIEVLQKLLIAFIILLVVVGLSRLIFRLQFPGLYQMLRTDLNPKEKWNILNKKEKTLIGLALFALFCLCFSLIVNGL